MTGGVLGGVRVVEIGHLLVPILGPRAAQVGPGHEGALAADLDLGLEGTGEIRVVPVRAAPVDQEHRHRARPRRDLRAPLDVDGPFDHVEPETVGVRDRMAFRVLLRGSAGLWIVGSRLIGSRITGPERTGSRLIGSRITGPESAGLWSAGPRERHPYRAFVGPPLPDLLGLSLRILRLRTFVIAPAHDHRQGVRLPRNEEAQPHRGRKEAFLRRPALLRRLLRETARCRRLVEVVVLVRIRAALRVRAGRDQEAGQIPVRGTHPAGQPLARVDMACPGADEIEVQGFDQVLADLGGASGFQGAGGCEAPGRRGRHQGCLRAGASNEPTSRHSLSNEGAIRAAASRSKIAVSAG